MNNSLAQRVQEIWTITKKELVHCTRDAHVIVYSLILPIVFYPLIIIGASEFFLWRDGLTQKSPIKICIDTGSKAHLTEFSKLLKKYKNIKEVDLDKPMEALKRKEIEGFLKVKEDKSGMIAYLNPSSDRFLETKMYITTIASAAKNKETTKVLNESGLPKNMLKVYSLKIESLAEITEAKTEVKLPHKYAMIKSLIIGVLCVYTLVIIQSGTVYPALTSFTLEIEKKTKLTTQLIPVEPWHIVIGKFVSVLIVSLTTAIINLTSLAFVALYFFVKMPWSTEVAERTMENVTFVDVFAVLSVFFLSVVLLSSTYCLVASVAKSFKEAQNISSGVLISTMLLPAVALIPGLTLDKITVLIPLSNLVLAAKGIVSDNVSYFLVLIAVLANLALSLGFLYLAKVFFLDVIPGFLKPSASGSK